MHPFSIPVYLLFTANLPQQYGISTATYADNTAVLVTNNDPNETSTILENHLNEISMWFKKWQIQPNEKNQHM